MKVVITTLLFITFISTSFIPLGVENSAPEGMVYVNGGSYSPIYSIDTNIVETGPFYIDVYPITNADFYQFLKEYPKWKKDQVKLIFADQRYLSHWPDDVDEVADLEEIKKQPVVNVSWFAAKKYCECQDKRLPTVDEWELVALASETKPVGADDPEFYQDVLDWYSKPSKGKLGEVGSTFKNYHGVYDIYGLVWEWVMDFNTALISGESRKDNSLDKNLFCGGAAAGASDPGNYVAYMRYAFRASLEGNYTVGNLGFRCAKDIKDEK